MRIRRKVKKLKLMFKHRSRLRALVNSYLFFVEIPEKSPWGSITEEDEKGIRFAVSQASNYEGPIVEIGVLFGHTTNLIATLKQQQKELIGVENFSWNPFYLTPDAHRQFTMRTLRYAIDHCSTQVYEGNAEDFYAENEALRPSLVFIDSVHDYHSVKRDIGWAVSTGCPVISGHDYIDIHPGVMNAVDEVFGEDISLYGSVWVYEKQKAKPRGPADRAALDG